MNRFFVQLEYDGTKYHGFQKQPKTTKTIQHHLDKALAKVANHKISTVCCGRTDAGVHAFNQFIHFDTSSFRKIDSWIKGVNTNLPDDIVVKNFYKVDKNYHARFNAASREYLYIIKNTNIPPAIGSNNCLWIKQTLNIKRMNNAAKHLLGEKDFSAFRSSGCQSKSPIREITKAEFKRKGKYIFFFIKGNAFMLNMVRIIMGTLLDVGADKINISDFKEIIQQKNRKKAGKTISPKGLYFLGPEYNELNYTKEAILHELD